MLASVVEATDNQRRALVTVCTGDQDLSGRLIELQPMTIGRGGDVEVDLVVADRLLSRHHATFELDDLGRVHLVDNQSRNGCFVDGARVQRRRLEPGDVVRVGVTVFVVDHDDRMQLPEVRAVGRRDRLVGCSRAFTQLEEAVDTAAQTGAAVVVTGEAGSGKSLVASEIHLRSRREGSAIALSCRGTTPLAPRDLVGSDDGGGFFGAAEDGTLILDEVDLLPPELQDVLRIALREGTYRPEGGEERPFTARVVATTSAGLDAAVSAGVFAAELRDLLSQREIELPPLRDRRVDIPLLLRHFLALEEPDRPFDWSATCLEKLLVHHWPKNLRELRQISRRMLLVDDDVVTLRSAHLPQEILAAAPRTTQTASAIPIQTVPSRDELQALLEQHRGDAAKLAEHYKKDRRHIYRWLARHDLSAQPFR